MNVKNAIFGLALSGAVLGAAPASATVSWGTHDPVETGSISSLLGNFDFTLTSLSSLVASVSTTSGLGAVGLYSGNSLLGGLIYTSGSPISTSFSLAPGAYSYKFLNVGGTASITSVVTAVPEPEAYAMLLAGLGMIGVVVRRRLNN